MAPARDATQVVDEAYRVWNANGPRAFVEFTTQDVELHDAPELPDAETWVGRDAAVGRLEEVAQAVGGRFADIDDIREVRGEVLVSLTWRVDRESAATLAVVYHLVRVENERIDRVRVFMEKQGALAALGD